jgi:hypothetical protein
MLERGDTFLKDITPDISVNEPIIRIFILPNSFVQVISIPGNQYILLHPAYKAY